MKFFIALVLTALLSFSWALFFPWWIIAVAAFIVAALIPQRNRFLSFICAFLALFFLWGGQAVLTDIKNAHVLSAKVAEILPLGGSYILLILITALIGGLVAGLAALTGSFLRTPPAVDVKKYNAKKKVEKELPVK